MSIPSAFHSFEAEGPFSHCIECGKYLLEDECEYVIEKAVRNYPGFTAQDVIFDYAICLDCAQEVQKGISQESLKSIQSYLQQNLPVSKVGINSKSGVDGFISNCMISQKSVEECKEYQIFAFCKGNDLHPKMPPYMISDDVLEEMQQLLSAETRDELNGFFNKHFPPSPHLSQPDPRLILI